MGEQQQLYKLKIISLYFFYNGSNTLFCYEF